jgi:ketosteroid isomerase-like protein
VLQRRFTHVWRKTSGTWRLVARHANDIARP